MEGSALWLQLSPAANSKVALNPVQAENDTHPLQLHKCTRVSLGLNIFYFTFVLLSSSDASHAAGGGSIGVRGQS